MTRAELAAILEQAGFAHQPGGAFEALSTTFIRSAPANWFIGAHISWDGDAARHVDVGLMQYPTESTIGTRHRFFSEGALAGELAVVLAQLETILQEQDLLKCPDCGRWVVLKEPHAGAARQFRPFLSCEGMRMVGRGPNKGPQCRGTSNRILALVEHR